MTDEGETLLYVQDNLHPEPDTTETNSSEIDDVRAADADEDLELDLFVQNAVDPQTDAMPEPATMQELSVLSSKNAEALSLKEKRKAKPPIIDLPSTRVRAVDGDMAELDAEIAELRRTLSSKLSVQNEQLRQLLQRFPE
ncbi:hypothetical protein [Rhizobium sp.]|uniref:hypothetical protein n=1 Tax=Rhizobium sp. TaxID=391 RepID=UPI00289A3232